MDAIELTTYFDDPGHNEYQRENFDAFLHKVSFKYTVPSIHIAGSNGKSSTAYYLKNIYRAHGLKVGLFTSPFLIKVNEMITINGQNISDEDFLKLIKQNNKLFKKYHLSPFEMQTYIALIYFQQQKCDLAIIECGMGGEIDATNIFTPIMSVITSISLEHTTCLGRSVSEIALTKAGIIKERVPVVTGVLDDEALNTVVEVAAYKKAQVIVSVEPVNVMYANRGYNFGYTVYKDLRINIPAYYSLKDACIALEVVNKLLDRFLVTKREIDKGLGQTSLPVRMEIISEQPLIIIDGSHNPEGIFNLTKSLSNVAESRHIHVLFAAFKDKNIERMLAFLGEHSQDITLTTFPHERARKKEDYHLFLEDFPFKENGIEVLREMITKYPDNCILVTGSIAFAAYVKNGLLGG
ncbi:MAG: hypothetical protein GX813_00960 [Erysipelotrichia bacterium]|nr:hypothetical protein [Erysipelotrichia bacterium]